MNGVMDAGVSSEVVLCDPFFGSSLQYALSRLGSLEGRTVVEIGCGRGQLAAFFALRGARVVGCDRDDRALSDALALARRSGLPRPLELVRCDCERMPIESASADLVVSRSTLQYMRHRDVLDECLRVLKHDGALLLIENLSSNPWVGLYRARRQWTATTAEESAYLRSIHGYLTPEEIEDLRGRFTTFDRRENHLLRVVTAALRHRFHDALWTRALDAPVRRVDDWILGHVPWARQWAWQVVLLGKGKRA